MTDDFISGIYRAAVRKFGIPVQVMILCRELGELSEVAVRFFFSKKGGDITPLIDQLAAVEIMIDQIKEHLGLYGEVKKRKSSKLGRLAVIVGHDLINEEVNSHADKERARNDR